jgi:DNA invertase Pin-like site-specific DNA recombinase
LAQAVAQVEALAHLEVRFVAAKPLLETEAWTRSHWDILRAAAEVGRQGFSGRVKAGMNAAKQQGKRIGRPRLGFDRQEAQSMRAAGTSLRKIGARLAVSPTTIRRVTSESDHGPLQAS